MQTKREGREGPVENIKSDIDASMANVTKVVGSDSANIHPNLAFHFGLERLLLSAHCVV